MESQQFDCDVLIAGAGPVGKTIAVELARYGISHRVIDRASGPKDISKAMILHARTQEVQELMGVLPDSIAQGKPMRQLELHAYGKRIASVMTQVDSPHSCPLIIGQDRTERILEKRLNQLGSHVDWQTELLDFVQDGEGVTAKVRTSSGAEESWRCRFIVGAEGSNSVVRKTLNLPFEGGRYEGEQFIQADCKIRWTMPKGVSYLFLTTEGYMMVIEMPGDIVRVFISLPDSPSDSRSELGAALAQEAGAAEDKSNAPTLDEVQTNLVRLSGIEATLSEPVWPARYRTSHRYANKFREGRAFIAGDAAHVHVPLGGQGMNTGIQDGFNLSWKLAFVLKGLAGPELLDSYNLERHPVAEALIRGTDKSYKAILHPSEVAQAAIRRIGPFVLSRGFVRTKLMETLEEIKIAYHGSPLAEEHLGGRGVIAGDRAPDAVVVRLHDCETVRIHELLQGTQWTLFAFAGPHAASGEWESLHEGVRRIRSKYGRQVKSFLVVPTEETPGVDPETTLIDAELFAHDQFELNHPAVIVVRPDGYLGFRGRPDDAGKLDAYFERLFDPGASARN